MIVFFNNAMDFSMLINTTFVYFAGNSNVNYISLKVPANVNSYVWASFFKLDFFFFFKLDLYMLYPLKYEYISVIVY